MDEVVPDWPALKNEAFFMRNKIVHGVRVTAAESAAIEKRDVALLASDALCRFAAEHGVDLYAKLRVRINRVSIKL